MLRRILALVVKELLVTLRDRKSRIVLIALPLVQLLIFPHAATFEVRNLERLTFNEDRGQAGHDLVAAFAAAGPFRWRGAVTGEAALDRALETGRTDIVLRIPGDFSADLAAGRGAEVQAILDGRNSNTALIAAGYARRIAARAGAGLSAAAPAGPETRVLYNPKLRSTWFILPGLVGVLTLIVTLAITAFSLAREKEVGTHDQLRVTPLGAPELLIGKAAPGFVIGLGESGLRRGRDARLRRAVPRRSGPFRAGDGGVPAGGGRNRARDLGARRDAAAGALRRFPVRRAPGDPLGLRHADRQHAGRDRGADPGEPAALLHRDRTGCVSPGSAARGLLGAALADGGDRAGDALGGRADDAPLTGARRRRRAERPGIGDHPGHDPLPPLPQRPSQNRIA